MDRLLRVLVVDGQEIVLRGFEALLVGRSWVETVLLAGSCDQARGLTRLHEPHVAVVELVLGEDSGVAMCDSLQQESPTTRVLLVAGFGAISPQAAKAAGASGFVAKDRPAEEIAAAIHAVGNGRTVFALAEQPRAALSPRERQVLALMTTGATNREIATRLHLSPHTVKEHASRLYRKLDVRNRAQAVQRAERLGLTA